MFPKISKAAAAATVLLVSVAQTNACLCDGDVTSITTYNYVNELASNNTDVLVVRATALSREDLFSDQTDTTSFSSLVQTIGNNDPVTYTVSVTTAFLGNNTGGQDNITFVTEGNVNMCGVHLDIGEEYILVLNPALVLAYKGELTVNACGLARRWSEVSEEDEGDLYADLCDEDQESVKYKANYYCSDTSSTCDTFECDAEEQCTTKPLGWCRNAAECPKEAVCVQD